MRFGVWLILTIISWSTIASATAVQTPEPSSQMIAPQQGESSISALSPHKATYKIFRNDSELGKGERTVARASDGRIYLNSMSYVHWLFLSDRRTEQSWIKLDGTDVIPGEYQFTREGTGPDRQQHLIFDPQDKKLVVLKSYKDEPMEAKYHSGLYDALSYQLQMRLDVAAGKTDLTYPVIYKNSEHLYRFRKIGEEMLKLPIGRIATVKFERVRDNSSRETYIWLAKDYGYVIARLEQLKDGDQQADLRLAKYEDL